MAYYIGEVGALSRKYGEKWALVMRDMTARGESRSWKMALSLWKWLEYMLWSNPATPCLWNCSKKHLSFLLTKMVIFSPIEDQEPGDHLNIKMLFYQYRDPYVKDETVARLSYLEHGNPHTCLNIKILSYQYRDPHVKDKTVALLSYL